MNPSAHGWIKRYISEDFEILQENASKAEHSIYIQLRSLGFIYGTNITYFSRKHNNQIKLTQEELAKVNLFAALAIIYFRYNVDGTLDECVESILKFYNTLGRHDKKYFQFHLVKFKAEHQLENLIQHRIKTKDNFIQKNFSNIVTNALLFIDVLAYKSFLVEHKDPIKYSTLLEKLIVNIIYLTIVKSEFRGKYDEMLIKLIQSSLRFYNIDHAEFGKMNSLDVGFLSGNVEKNYIIDLGCMIIYSDDSIHNSKFQVVQNLASRLKFGEVELYRSIYFLKRFVAVNKNDIHYFNISNPLKYFYDNTTRSVSVLLRRNRKRIIREVTESRELMSLLVVSNKRSLTEDEKQKVKSQLIDIVKTIPSLAIFALPGGSILLPVLIKMMPNILPSSFNENNLN